MFVQTRSSVLKNHCEESCQTIFFKTKKNKKESFNENATFATANESSMKKDKELEMKRLRYEVIKFGTSGFQGSKKAESKIALAVALGAKPPKNRYRNYAEILAEKKADKEKKGKVNQQMERKLFPAKKASKGKRRSGKRNMGLLRNYGKKNQINFLE